MAWRSVVTEARPVYMDELAMRSTCADSAGSRCSVASMRASGTVLSFTSFCSSRATGLNTGNCRPGLRAAVAMRSFRDREALMVAVR
jgi:hypothetical protein